MQATSLYDIQINAIDGSSFDLSTLKGKHILFVNLASECGYTKQYADLQKLHELHGDKIHVVGVPSNDFGGQEPGTSEEIVTFCQKNFGVTFQLLEKVKIKGDTHPLYQWLTSKEANGVADHTVKWNFHKFLVSPEGKLISDYGSGVSPTGPEILAELTK